MIPIGFGQKEAIIGDIGRKKTTIVIGIMKNLKHIPKVLSIYVSIGQSTGSVLSIQKKLQQNETNNFLIIMARPSDPMSMLYLAPLIASAIGEYYRTKGYHVVIFYDSLNKHAIANREISMSQNLSPGRESFPGNMFAIHANLLERAGQMLPENGEGSLTCIPIVDTVDNDITSFISTTIISISDGQIVMDKNSNINIGLSVSRVGGDVQHKYIKQYSRGLKLKITRYEECLQLSTLTSELSPEVKKILKEGSTIKSILLQDFDKPMPLYKQILYLKSIYDGLVFENDNMIQLINNYINNLTPLEFTSDEILDRTYKSMVYSIKDTKG